jgi:hypothetical protein
MKRLNRLARLGLPDHLPPVVASYGIERKMVSDRCAAERAPTVVG